MSPTALDGLRERLGEPQWWGQARPELWSASQACLGLVLPTDYKAFLDLFGPGAVDGYLWLDRPVDGTREEAEELWPLEEKRRDDLEVHPWPFHPEEGGLINWGHDEQANWYYFLTLEPDPDDWRIIVRSEIGEWFETAGTFTEFLLRCFERVDRPPFLDYTWPGKNARYHVSEPSADGPGACRTDGW
ncbi:SMI1/KNR4 family protein [Streptomyces sp. CBMA156]|uniref:SMI1/KNR4 family protein n=1 Tax=Streptomyces sp. CBMA156 TaxID=1930280 RepID=UPI001662127D|nr:SMI1/KNR4 family protein [Streptomyces sp. CBMA156]MBD0670426.1 hypothetical protein [Streptomyces sp. CBMA156]MBD0675209.1 hypothetical protein [Streptomyces sp. CBMA156]